MSSWRAQRGQSNCKCFRAQRKSPARPGSQTTKLFTKKDNMVQSVFFSHPPTLHSKHSYLEFTSVLFNVLHFQKNYKLERCHWNERMTHYFISRFLEFETPMRFYCMWISHTVDFHICSILHVTISEELIAHNTAMKWLRIIPSLGSSQIRVWTPQRAYRSRYDILWTFTLETSLISQIQRNSSSIMTRNKFWLFHFANWRTEFQNSLVLLLRVNNTLCVCLCLYNHLFDDSSSDDSELDAHTKTLRNIPCRIIITNSWTHLWLTNHTLLWSPTEYFNERIHSLLQITRTVKHSRVRCSNAAQSWANAHTTPYVWEPVYFAHSHMSQRSYWKWKIHSNEMSIYLVLYIAPANGDCTIWEELQTLTLKRKTDALFHLTIFTHTMQSLKLRCAPIACEFHILWIFTFVISSTLQSS